MRSQDNLTLRQARKQFFEQSGFEEGGGYQNRWVHFWLGPVPVLLPNFKARKRALPLHDLHHIATGYETDSRGEFEIAAWELAAGCGRYWAAWVLNLMAQPLGFALMPRRMWAAWKRGRHSHSLYGERYSESMLDKSVGDLRSELGLAS